MIKSFLIWIIKVYKKIPGPWHGACIYHPTCSTYAIEALETHGVLIGLGLTLKRLLRCNPWGKPGYDPVPARKSKEKKGKNDD